MVTVKKHRWLLLLLTVWGATLLMASAAWAGVGVYPTFLFLNAPNRAVSLVVTNSSAVTSEIWIDFRYGYPVGDDSGNIYMRYADSSDIGEQSATGWIRAFPQRIVLESQESQKIRLLVSPPSGLSSKEYWARVIIHSKDREDRVSSTVQGQTRSGMKLLTNVDVPFHYRSGLVSTGVILQNLELETKSGVLNVKSELARTGNAAYWGIYRLTLRDQLGKTILLKEQNIVVYQNLKYTIPLDISKCSSGSYTLEVEISSQRRDIRREHQLISDPVRRNVNVVIP